jgi:hypothetical protein
MDLQWTGEIGSDETQLPLLVTHVSCLFPSHYRVSQWESLATLSLPFKPSPGIAHVVTPTMTSKKAWGRS